MEQRQILKIDHFNPRSRKKVFSRQPLLSSHKLNWDSMVFNYHVYTDDETSEYIQAHHNMGIYLNDTHKEERLNGRLVSSDQSRNCLTILPQGHSYASAWKDQLEFIVLSIKPKKLAEFAPELIEPSSVELLPCLNAEPDLLVTSILMNFMQEIGKGLEPSEPLIEHLQNALLAHLLQNYCSKQLELKQYNGLPAKKLSMALNYINDNLHQSISLADIAKLLDISPGYFGRLFKESMEISPHQYITHRRIEKTQILLKNNQVNLSIKEIARGSGFKSYCHFSRRFRQVTGVSPRQYRKSS